MGARSRDERPAAGTGVLLHSDAVIVMQIHYNLLHAGHAHASKPDRSSVALKLVPAAGSTLTPLDTFLAPAPVELPCPAGMRSALLHARRRVSHRGEEVRAGRRVHLRRAALPLQEDDGRLSVDRRRRTQLGTSCDRTVNRPLRIYGVAGHMHLRGVDIRIELNPGTPRAQTLLHIPHWDFHWQDAYYLEHPVDADDRRHDSRQLPFRQLAARAAGRGRQAARAAVRALGRGHDRRDVPRAAPGRHPHELAALRCPGRIAIYASTAERRWSGSDFIKYGQWRYQRVEVRPRDLRGIA